MGDNKEGYKVGPWAFFQGRPAGKARLSYKQALRLWSGFSEARMPKRPCNNISIVKGNNKADKGVKESP